MWLHFNQLSLAGLVIQRNFKALREAVHHQIQMQSKPFRKKDTIRVKAVWDRDLCKMLKPRGAKHWSRRNVEHGEWALPELSSIEWPVD
jgi:hypothetical protein